MPSHDENGRGLTTGFNVQNFFKEKLFNPFHSGYFIRSSLIWVCAICLGFLRWQLLFEILNIHCMCYNNSWMDSAQSETKLFTNAEDTKKKKTKNCFSRPIIANFRSKVLRNAPLKTGFTVYEETAIHGLC